MIKTLPQDDNTREALQQAAASLSTAMQAAQPHAISQALRNSARIHASLLNLEKAEADLQQALRWAVAVLATDLCVDLLCDLCDMTELWASAEDQQQDGEGAAVRERMRNYAYEAGALVGGVSDPKWEIQVLLRLARALKRCGEEEDAAMMHARAVNLMEGANAEPANPHVMPGIGRLVD
jgi:tetratricopeptide (TPR) repeat protein